MLSFVIINSVLSNLLCVWKKKKTRLKDALCALECARGSVRREDNCATGSREKRAQNVFQLPAGRTLALNATAVDARLGNQIY